MTETSNSQEIIICREVHKWFGEFHVLKGISLTVQKGEVIVIFVLRHSNYGEADRLLTLYTRQLGKTRALAKGARKIASRKAGHIEPFTHVKLQLAKGRDMLILTQADTVDAYQPLREDLILTGQASE